MITSGVTNAGGESNDLVSRLAAIAELVIAFGLLLNWAQMRNDHKRSRREKAVDLMFHWASQKERKADAARILGEALDFQQTRAVQVQSPFTIDAQHRELLASVLDVVPPEKGGKISISGKDSSEIRHYIVKYLNGLESVLSAWRHHVADRDSIDEEFRNFISHENKEYILEHYRQAAGGKHSYPALAQFVRHVKDQEEDADRGSKKKIL